MTHTQKFIETFLKNCKTIEGEIQNNGKVTYRHDSLILNYESAANFLVKLFQNAAIENGKNYYDNQFISGDYSFYFQRPKFKGEKNGKIIGSKLVIFKAD